MRTREEAAARMRAEAGKPFARTADDPELDASLRGRARFGDPMAHLARRGAAADAPPPPVVPAHLARQFRKSGFIVPQARPASGVVYLVSGHTPWTCMRAGVQREWSRSAASVPPLFAPGAQVSQALHVCDVDTFMPMAQRLSEGPAMWGHLKVWSTFKDQDSVAKRRT